MSYVGNTVTTQGFIPAVDYFNGTGSATAFTLSKPVASVAQVQAVISNVVQNPSDAYTVSGNTITFTSAPPTGTNNVYVYYTSPITQVIAPGQGTVTGTSLNSGSTTGTGNIVLATSPTITTPTISQITSATATALTLQSAGTTAITVDTSQNVGIGTTSPASLLDVDKSQNAATSIRITNTNTGSSANARFLVISDGGNVQVKAMSTTNTTYGVGDVGVINCDNMSGGLRFSHNDVVGMTFDSSGNLLVGGTSVVYYSHILSTFNGATQYGFVANDTSNTANSGFHAFTLSGTAIGSITRVGVTSAVAYNTTSDQRLKSNIADSQSVLDKLMSVKVRQYDWTEGQVHQDYGFIAQELEPLLSGIVTKGKTEEDMWQLDYAKLTPHLVKAIQEQQALIISLTARITALENR